MFNPFPSPVALRWETPCFYFSVSVAIITVNWYSSFAIQPQAGEDTMPGALQLLTNSGSVIMVTAGCYISFRHVEEDRTIVIWDGGSNGAGQEHMRWYTEGISLRSDDPRHPALSDRKFWCDFLEDAADFRGCVRLIGACCGLRPVLVPELTVDDERVCYRFESFSAPLAIGHQNADS